MEVSQLTGKTWPSAGLAAVFALAVNLPNLGTPAPWRDEAATWMANQRSLPELFGMLGNVDAVHGLYYLLMRSWQLLFTDSVLSLRLASTAAVAITAALLVVLGAAMFNLGVGRWAGLVYGLLPQVTWAAVEARSYALTAAAVTIAFLALWVALSRDTWAHWLGYAAAAAVAVHLFLFSALAFLAVLPLLPALPRQSRLRATLATAAAAVVSLPFALVSVSQSGQVSWLANHELSFEWVVLRTVWGSGEWSAWLGTALLLAALVLAAFGLRDRAARAPLLAVSGWFVLPIVTLVAVHPVQGVFFPRYVTFTAPALALLLGWAVHRVRPWWGRAAVVALVVAACLPPLLDSRTPAAKSGSPAAGVARLAAESRDGDGLLIVGKDENALLWAFDSELTGLDAVGTDPDPDWRWRELAPRSVVPTRRAPELGGERRVWLFAGRAAVGSELDAAKQAMQRLGFAVRDQIRVKEYYPVTLVLMERASDG